MKGISPNFSRRCVCIHRCGDWILGSKGQTSRSKQETTWMQYLCNNWSYFHQSPVTYVSGPGHILIWLSGQKVKGQGHSRRRLNRWWQLFCMSANAPRDVSVLETFQRGATPPGLTPSMPCGYALPRMLEHHTLRDLLWTWAACAWFTSHVFVVCKQY